MGSDCDGGEVTICHDSVGSDCDGGEVTICHDIVGSDGDGGQVTILWLVMVTVDRSRYCG